jgi:hypothetical protein
MPLILVTWVAGAMEARAGVSELVVAANQSRYLRGLVDRIY